MTVALGTAYLDEAELCDHVLLMADGEVRTSGTPADLMGAGPAAAGCWRRATGWPRAARPAAPGTGSPGGDGWRGGGGAGSPAAAPGHDAPAAGGAGGQRRLSTGPAPAGMPLSTCSAAAPAGSRVWQPGCGKPNCRRGLPEAVIEARHLTNASAISPPPMMSALRCAAADLRPARPQRGGQVHHLQDGVRPAAPERGTGAGDRHRSGLQPLGAPAPVGYMAQKFSSTSSSPWPRTSPSSPVSTACSAATSRRGSTPW